MSAEFAKGLKSMAFYLASVLKQAGANPTVLDIIEGRVDLEGLNMPEPFKEVMCGQFQLLRDLLENLARNLPSTDFDGRVLRIDQRSFELDRLTIDEFYHQL